MVTAIIINPNRPVFACPKPVRLSDPSGARNMVVLDWFLSRQGLRSGVIADLIGEILRPRSRS